jgi:hypothetical protein
MAMDPQNRARIAAARQRLAAATHDTSTPDASERPAFLKR